MKKIGLAFFSAALMAASFGVAKADDATPQSCTTMGVQTQSALDGNQQSSNYQNAVKERNAGRSFCLNGMQKQGIQHYAQALKLLGINS